jgi:hypothetical protein
VSSPKTSVWLVSPDVDEGDSVSRAQPPAAIATDITQSQKKRNLNTL